MSPVIARALRRAALAGGALAATLIGHALTVGDARVLPVAPLLWLSAIALAFLPGVSRRTAAFRAWGPLTLLAILLLGQSALHLLLHAAPWALGLGVEHAGHGPLISVSAVLVHLTLAVALTALLRGGQGLLLRAMEVARALLRRPLRRSALRVGGEVSRRPLVASSQWRFRPRSSRGPPPPAPSRAGSGLAVAASTG
jgi:hypothetical protein